MTINIAPICTSVCLFSGILLMQGHGVPGSFADSGIPHFYKQCVSFDIEKFTPNYLPIATRNPFISWQGNFGWSVLPGGHLGFSTVFSTTNVKQIGLNDLGWKESFLHAFEMGTTGSILLYMSLWGRVDKIPSIPDNFFGLKVPILALLPKIPLSLFFNFSSSSLCLLLMY